MRRRIRHLQAGPSGPGQFHPDVNVRLENAFTLLELMVAMAMVVVLALTLYSSMRVAFHASQAATAAVELPRTADITMGFLRTDLQNALQVKADNSSILVGNFVGTDGKDDRGVDADDLVLFTSADSPDHQSANGDVKKVELLISTPAGTNDHALVRRVTRNLLSQVDPTPDEEVLCRHCSGFSLRYFDGTDWQDNWDSTQYANALPAAVEVTLTLDNPDGQPAGKTRYTHVFAMPCSTTTSTGLSGFGGGL